MQFPSYLEATKPLNWLTFRWVCFAFDRQLIWIHQIGEWEWIFGFLAIRSESEMDAIERIQRLVIPWRIHGLPRLYLPAPSFRAAIFQDCPGRFLCLAPLKGNHLAPKLKGPGTYIDHKKSAIHGSVKWDPSWVPGDPSWNPSTGPWPPGAHWHPGRGSYPMHTPKKITKNFRYLKWRYSPIKAVCKADVRQTSPPKQRYKVHRWSLWLFVHFLFAIWFAITTKEPLQFFNMSLNFASF